ncbi:MAG: cytochrome c family protein [Proteobacteria bacterium]|nr:cytochrome c family protein [Pseudomonadota bacterium]MBU1736569.1 cytochrome c family protein [Pseudomonadota bacterium]
MALTFAVGASVAGNAGPETVKIDTPKKGGTSVNFDHKKHQGMAECAACHHTKNADGSKGAYEAGKEAKCASCHDGSLKDDVADAKKAAHKNCKGCHKDGVDGKTGPTKCDGCHTK